MALFDRLLSPKHERWLIEPVEIQAGTTPKWIRNLVKDGVVEVFDNKLKAGRSDNALYLARTIVRVLRDLEVRAWVVAGSASWKKYPIGFVYKGRPEFHAWVVTEFDEIVDLSCDNMHKRKSLPMRVPKGPKTCWAPRARVRDRTYKSVANAAEDCGVFGTVSEEIESAGDMLTGFINQNREKYEGQR